MSYSPTNEKEKRLALFQARAVSLLANRFIGWFLTRLRESARLVTKE
jgi:hypothetical protein